MRIDTPYPGLSSTLIAILRHRALHQADQCAYVFLDQGETETGTLTYGDLDREARRVAVALQSRVAASARVLLCYPPGLDYLVAFFGCLYAGAVPVLAYPPDTRRPTRTLPRLQVIVRDAQATVGLTTHTFRQALESLAAAPEMGVALQWLATDVELEAAADDWEETRVAGDALAFLMYTSGSTSEPKGVMVSHRNVLHNLSTFPGFKHRPCRTFVSWLPFFHDLGLLFGALHPLYQGVPAVLMPPAAFVQRPLRWLQAVSRYQASTTGGPNFAYDLCIRKTTTEQREGLDLRNWNMALNGAEPVRPETLDRFAAVFGPCGFRCEAWYPSYGLAEGTATVSGGWTDDLPVTWRLRKRAFEQNQVVEASTDDAHALHLVGCGRTLLHDQQIAIVSPETHTRCPPDQIGEIWVGGPSVALGYWNRPQETERVFRAYLADTDEGPFLRTGDLGFLHGDELFIAGRLKDVIIIRGRNLYPQDIEAAMERCHAALHPGGSAAFSVDVAGVERLVLVAEAQPDLLPDVEAVIGDIRQAIAEQYEVEAYAIVLIKPGSLPKTSSGKIRHASCREAYLAARLDAIAIWQAPAAPPDAEMSDSDIRERDASGDLARSRRAAITDWLIAAVAQRAGLEPQQIDPRQPFARYGLASLEVVSMLGELETWLGRSLSPTLSWDCPTIDALARYLADDAPAARNENRLFEPARLVREPIALIGMSCRLPGAASPQAFWRLLCDGVDAITETPPNRWDADSLYDPDPAAPGKTNSRWGGFVENLDRFDAHFFGISPREAMHLDPRQRLMLEIAWEALEDAGIPADSLAGSRTGVFVATLTNDYHQLLFSNLAQVDAYSGPGTANSIVANRLSYAFDLCGPSVAVDTACSGSLVALHLACQSLHSGESSLALAAGVSVNLLPNQQIFFAKAGLLSPNGRCNTFDAAAAGIVRSEGAGLVVLKRLSQALADGDPIYAVIRGSAINNDGRSNGLMAPNGRAQEALLWEAYRDAGISPGRVQYVEAHGTGTRLGDPIEIQALGKVLRHDRVQGNRCAIGSVKTNLGHLEPVAGIAGIIKVALSLKHRRIPPSLHVQELNPLIPFDDLPLSVQRTLGPWPVETEPLIAGVSSFGVGGTNAHIVLEQAPADGRTFELERASDRPYLLLLSARDPQALRALAAAYQEFVPGLNSTSSLRDICYTAAIRRSHQDCRLAAVVRSLADLPAQMEAFLRGESRPGLSAGSSLPGRSRKLVFVFSGQGSHWRGMGLSLLDREPIFRAALERCDLLLRRYVDWSLIDELRADVASSRLNETEIAQPAIFAIQVALAALWRSWGIAPDAVTGQSLGEIAAAHVAGALSLEDALRVVVHRSLLMKRMDGQGKTAVIGLPLDQARQAIATDGALIGLAGSNSPKTSVLSGDRDALERAIARLEQQGIFCRLLHGVDIAFHSSQMEPLKGELVRALTGLEPRPTSVPIFSTMTGDTIAGGQLDAAYWGRNLRDPFLFSVVFEKLVTGGYDLFLEVSPHPVLAQAMLEGLQHYNTAGTVLPSLRRNEDESSTLLASLGTLYTAARSVDWAGVYSAGGCCVTLPAYPWQRERHWFDQLDTYKPAPPSWRTGDRRGETHPLLGEQICLALAPAQRAWELDFSAGSLHYLDKHQVLGTVVFPGAAFLEMAFAAAHALGTPSVELQNVTFKQMLALPANETRTIQLIVAPAMPERSTFQILSRPAGRPAEASWSLHAIGTMSALPHDDLLSETGAMIPDIQARCVERISSSAHYEAMRERGLDYGASFQAVEQVWRRDGEALSRIIAPKAVSLEADSYLLHPVLLDAAFQVVAAALPRRDQSPGDVYLPVGVERIRIAGRPGAQLWCHVLLRSGAQMQADVYEADLHLFDDAGQTIARVTDVCLQRVGGRLALYERPADWLYRLEWQPNERSAHDAETLQVTHPGIWLIFADRGGVGEALSELLEAQGALCVVVLPGQRHLVSIETRRCYINPVQSEAFLQLFDDLAHADLPPCCGVIHLWGLDGESAEETTLASLQRAQELGCVTALHIAQALGRAQWDQLPRLWLVTRGCRTVGAAQGPASIAYAPLWGLGQVIAQEHPEFWGGLIDLDPTGSPDEITAVFEELWRPDQERQLAMRGGERYVARLVRAGDLPPAARSVQFHANGSYLITGGLGGLGLQVARWLVERGARRLILMGRAPLPPRVEWNQIEAGSALGDRIHAIRDLEALGASIHLAAVDVADEEQLGAFFDTFRQEGWPPIRGVIHAAGMLQDQILLRMDHATLEAVLRPKVLGAWLLHRLLSDAPLDFFVLFSSAAALLGPPGQGNYAAGNAFLDALAHHRRIHGLPALSLNWGPWAEVGMAAQLQLREQHLHQGVATLTPVQNLQALTLLFEHDPVQVAVLSADWTRLNQLTRNGPLLSHLVHEQVQANSALAAMLPAHEQLQEQLLLANPEERQSLVQFHLQQLAAAVLRIDPMRLDPWQPLTALGMDSIMAVELKNGIETSFGATVSMVDLLQGSSLIQLTIKIVSEIQSDPDIAELLAAVEQLSSEEVQVLLAETR